MKFIHAFTALALLFAPLPVLAAAQTGQPAPDFEATAINGETFKLSDHQGKTVVLEWTNHQCPYVMKHYDTGNMQRTQAAANEQDVVWVTIVSSAPGSQGHVSPEEAQKIVDEAGASPDYKIMDESGEIGQAYGAQTTPHMYVIDGQGTLVYAGAIDDNSSPRHETVETANNYVLAALNDLASGRPVQTPTSQPYGCAVKYKK